MMSIGAVTAQAAWATTGGEIGLVDANPLVAGTQGATLVKPGVSGQAIGDVRVLLPNTFVSGDTIDLTVFDRTATAIDPGSINIDTAHKFGFGGVPTVAVNSTPMVTGTHIETTSPGAAGGTENVPVADTATTKATTPPVFTTSVVSSSRATPMGMTDIIRLTVNGTASGGDTADKWIVTLSGLNVSVGTAVSPGEIRVVPVAYSGVPNSTLSNFSTLFAGNKADDPTTLAYDPIIHTYTVPAYVSPVDFTIGSPNNIVADGTGQSLGDVTIAETNNYSLQAGTYTVDVGGATVVNHAVTVTATNPATGESVSSPATLVTGVNGSASFTLAQTNIPLANAGKVTITLSGLMLSDTSPGPISYTLSGGSIDQFLTTAGTSPAIGSAPPAGVLADSAFLTGGTVAVNQADIEAPGLSIESISTAVSQRIGGLNRYDTAAKIALAASSSTPNMVLASGLNFPDALSSGYLANEVGGSILLTDPGFIPAITLDTLRQLGTSTVYIVGGPSAVSNAIEAQLKATPQYYPNTHETVGQGMLQVIRLGGANRYETNKLANLYAQGISAFPVGRTQITFGQPSKSTALVASGANFPDAIAGGPATAGRDGCSGITCGGLPLILTDPSSLSTDAAAQLLTLGIEQAVIFGGTSAVSAADATSIAGLVGSVDRLGGVNRYDTAAMIADFETAGAPTSTTDGGLFFSSTTAFLASGLNFPDALAGAPLAGGNGSPIMLTDPSFLPSETDAWLTGHAADYTTVVALGLGSAVFPAVLAAANAAVSTL
jgi:putative cell wall-binding protein